MIRKLIAIGVCLTVLCISTGCLHDNDNDGPSIEDQAGQLVLDLIEDRFGDD